MLAAAISGTLAVVVAVLTAGATYFLTKRREHYAEWRKLKLERYTELVIALSMVVQQGRVTREAQLRYANAVNSISLVAPPPVLKALYAFQDDLSTGDPGARDGAHQRLNELLHAIRRDIDPSRRSRETVFIRFRSAPPCAAPLSEVA